MARQSTGSCSSGASSVDNSFVSMASFSSAASTGSSYEIESEVGREALREICCSALSRLLDFPDHQLETLLGRDEERREDEEDGGINVAKNIAASLRMMKRSIGTGLSALSHRTHRHGVYELREDKEDGGNPPTGPFLKFGTSISSDSQIVALQLIAHVQTLVTHEGLFRKPGNKTRMDQLVKDLGEKEFCDVIASQVYRAHDYASVLKQFFSDLPEPLLLRRHTEAYHQAAVLSSPLSTVRCLQLLTLLLPPSHRLILQHLLELLSQTAATEVTKMDAGNLALVFAPTLFLTSLSSNDSSSFPSESLEKLVTLLKFMIENCDEIFEVPTDVQIVAERHCKKKNSTQEDDIPLEMYTTCCKRVCADEFHSSGQDRAIAEVASLFELVQKMPDGPQKTHFMKRFESCKTPGASPYVKKSKSYFGRAKENTPKIPRLKLGHGIGSHSVPRQQSSKSQRTVSKKDNVGQKLQFCATPQTGRTLKAISHNTLQVTDV